MSELRDILNNMDLLLQSLKDILNKEQLILIENSLPHELKSVIDEKNDLLIKLKLLDEKREIFNKENNISAPYENIIHLKSLWEKILKETSSLSKINHDNGILLQKRIDVTQQSIEFFGKLNNSNVYGSEGYTQTNSISTKRAEA